jgi:hypothetical protein
MAYTKTTWQDEVLSGAERFEILDNAGAAVDAWADLANCQIQLATAVTTTGTTLDATHLNNIEDGIEDLATGAARSVKGVAGGAAGDVDDIEAGTDGYVLRRSGTSIGFGQIALGAIPDTLITEGKLATAVSAQLVTNGDSHDHSGGDGAAIPAGGLADGAVNATAKLANDIVDKTKLGNGAIQFPNRQGGHAANWSTAGTTSYTPTMTILQTGVIEVLNTDTQVTITFPSEFGEIPLIQVTPGGGGTYFIPIINSITATQCVVDIFRLAGSTLTSGKLFWQAMGEE